MWGGNPYGNGVPPGAYRPGSYPQPYFPGSPSGYGANVYRPAGAAPAATTTTTASETTTAPNSGLHVGVSDTTDMNGVNHHSGSGNTINGNGGSGDVHGDGGAADAGVSGGRRGSTGPSPVPIVDIPDDDSDNDDRAGVGAGGQHFTAAAGRFAHGNGARSQHQQQYSQQQQQQQQQQYSQQQQQQQFSQQQQQGFVPHSKGARVGGGVGSGLGGGAGGGGFAEEDGADAGAASKTITIPHDQQAGKVHVMIVFHSPDHKVWRIAEAVRAGAREVRGVTVSLYQVPEILDPEALERCGYREAKSQFAHVPTLTLNKLHLLKEADAIVLGFSPSFGQISAEMKSLFEWMGELWIAGSLTDKVASVFSAASTQAAGQELAVFSTLAAMLQFGMVLVGGGSTDIQNPYGVISSGNIDGSPSPSTQELEAARAQGRHVAEVSLKIKRGSREQGGVISRGFSTPQKQ